MGGGFEALLEVWRAPLDLSQKVSSTRRKWNWFKYRFKCRSKMLEGEMMHCHRLLVNQFLNKIKKKSFIKKGVITKEKPIAPKANLSA
jgi:hypothetical protein